MKPEPENVQRLIRRQALVPSRTRFIDDVPRNVEAAAAQGPPAVQFASAQPLRQDLQRFDLPVEALQP
jgi:hypothetical protein